MRVQKRKVTKEDGGSPVPAAAAAIRVSVAGLKKVKNTLARSKQGKFKRSKRGGNVMTVCFEGECELSERGQRVRPKIPFLRSECPHLLYRYIFYYECILKQNMLRLDERAKAKRQSDCGILNIDDVIGA